MKNKKLERYLSEKKKEYQQLRRLIHKYVEKNYRILDNKIVDVHTNNFVYAISIIAEVETFFGVDSQTAFQVVQTWGFVRLPKGKWKDVYKSRYLVYSHEVRAEARTIRATWTPEMVDDLRAYHNIDAEAELTAMLSRQLAAEIDQDILNRLINGNNPTYSVRWQD